MIKTRERVFGEYAVSRKKGDDSKTLPQHDIEEKLETIIRTNGEDTHEMEHFLTRSNAFLGSFRGCVENVKYCIFSAFANLIGTRSAKTHASLICCLSAASSNQTVSRAGSG